MTTLSCILYNSEREEIKEKYVKILLDYGPDITIPNAWGDTPLAAAKANNYIGIINMLDEKLLENDKSRLALAESLHERLGADTPLAHDVLEKIKTNLIGSAKVKNKKTKSKKRKSKKSKKRKSGRR